jgi:hypothetical protein
MSDLEGKLFVNGSEYTAANPVVDAATGAITFTAPVSALQNYNAQVHLTDTAGNYEPNIIDVTIPSSPGPTVSFGNIVMITKSGQGCQGLTGTAFTDCTSAAAQKGDVVITVLDGTTDQPVEGATVKLYKQFTSTGTLLDTDVTDSDGKVTFDAEDYTYARVDVSKSGYKLSPNKIYHDEPTTENKLFIFPESSSPMSLFMKVTDENKESDIQLDMQTNTGKTCTVSPANKFCPYVEHKKDVNRGTTGYEYIDVQRMTESKYLFYAKQDDTTYGTCTSTSTAALHYGATPGSSFKHMFATKKHAAHHMPTTSATPYWGIYCFTGFGFKSIKHLNVVTAAKPTIAANCDSLYPAGGEYSLDTLVAQNAVASASQ